jgi:hypothetical protein
MQLEFKPKEVTPDAVFAMREMGTDQMVEAVKRLDKANAPVIVHQDEAGMFDRYIISSLGHFYEVLRLERFASCTCPSFTLGHKPCKHIAVTLEKLCTVCLGKRVDRIGDKCDECRHLTEGFLYRKAA